MNFKISLDLIVFFVYEQFSSESSMSSITFQNSSISLSLATKNVSILLSFHCAQLNRLCSSEVQGERLSPTASHRPATFSPALHSSPDFHSTTQLPRFPQLLMALLHSSGICFLIKSHCNAILSVDITCSSGLCHKWQGALLATHMRSKSCFKNKLIKDS